MKKYIFIMFFMVLLILTSCDSKVTINRTDYSEKMMYSLFEFNDVEKENINYYLNKYYVDENEFAGFSKYESQFNYYQVKNMLDLTLNCNDNFAFELLKENVYERFKSIKKEQISNGYELFNVVSILKMIGIPLNDNIIAWLDSYFDDKTSLFFMTGPSDTFEIKLSLTLDFYEILKDNSRFRDRYSQLICDSIRSIYNNYEFKFPKDNSGSMYNSGGRIIVAANEILSINDFEKNRLWYDEWKKDYDITDIVSASSFCDFHRIAQLFEDHKLYVLDNYLKNKYTPKLEDDLPFLVNVSKYIDLKVYDFYDKIELDKKVENIKLIKNNIDIENTFYGYLLGCMTGFDIEKNKINELLKVYYELIEREEDLSKLSHYLYYTVGLDICVNHSLPQNKDLIIERINYIFSNEIRSVDMRKVLEVISAMSIFEGIEISKNLISDVKDQIDEILNDENNYCNCYLSDMFIMNYDIDKSYDVNKIKKLKENLICDGGFLESSSSNDVNIVSTFAVFKLNSFLGDSLYIEENKEYVKKLEKNVGIYSYSLDDDSVSLNTIWYGNIISHSWVGFENGIKY